MFAETRGFTRMSEMLEPDVVLSRVAGFFTMVTEAVHRQHGTVVNVLNDTLVATFAGKDDAQRAVLAAQETQTDFVKLEESWQREYGIATAVAMGLHRGDVVVGQAGGPYPERPLVIGDGVSVAERLLHRARAGEFVLSQAIMDALAETGFHLDVDTLPAMVIPQRDPIQIYGVLLDTRLDFT
jgi:class 3 adenylate cyclase